MARYRAAYYSLEQAAQILGIGRSTAYRMARAGEFPVPVMRFGALLRVPKKPLHDLIGGEPELDERPSSEAVAS